MIAPGEMHVGHKGEQQSGLYYLNLVTKKVEQSSAKDKETERSNKSFK